MPDAANALNIALTPTSWIVRTQVPPQSLSSRIQDELPIVFAGVPLVLAAVALVAVGLPARRASLVDPIVALRVE